MQIIRIALSMQETTPGGATDLLEVLGKTESINRIGQVLSYAASENVI